MAALALTFSAQANPTFHILVGISNAATKATMERNVNNLIALLNSSAEGKKKKISLKEATYVTPRVRETIEKMWDSSMMRFPDADIKASCLRVMTGGFQV